MSLAGRSEAQRAGDINYLQPRAKNVNKVQSGIVKGMVKAGVPNQLLGVLNAYQGVVNPVQAAEGAADSFGNFLFNAREGEGVEAAKDLGLTFLNAAGAVPSGLLTRNFAKSANRKLDDFYSQQAASYNKSIEGTNFPQISGIVRPNDVRLDGGEQRLIYNSIDAAKKDLDAGVPKDKIFEDHNIIYLDDNTPYYAFKQNAVKYDMSRLNSAKVGEEVPLRDIMKEGPFVNMNSLALDDIKLSKEPYPKGKEGLDRNYSGIAYNRGGGKTSIHILPKGINNGIVNKQTVLHEVGHGLENAATLGEVGRKGQFVGTGVQQRLKDRIKELKRIISKPNQNEALLPEYLKALQGDAREELAMLTRPGLFGRRPLTEEMIYMRNPSEVLARAGEDGAGSVKGYSELTRSQFLNPKINQYIDPKGKKRPVPFIDRMGGVLSPYRADRGVNIPQTFEDIMPLNQVRTRQIALRKAQNAQKKPVPQFGLGSR
tara:strand:- start:33 stop:1487 length:1455 start_codon:yes stop_codon:yes gene_type:complete